MPTRKSRWGELRSRFRVSQAPGPVWHAWRHRSRRRSAHLPRQASRKQHIEQIVLEVDVAGQSIVALAQKKPVGDGNEAVFVLWRARVQRFPREQRWLGYFPVAGLEHQLIVAHAGHSATDIVGVQPRHGCPGLVLEGEPRGGKRAIASEQHAAYRRRGLGGG